MQSISVPLLIGLFVVTVAAAMLAFEGGVRFGRWRSRKPHPEPQEPAKTLLGGVLSMLAFILGFAFGLASSHFDARSTAVFDEAVAIGTAYHRADLLPDSERAEMRRLLQEYVDLRIDVGQFGKRADLDGLRQMQERIWSQAVAVAKRDGNSSSASPLLQSLTDVIDLHGERVLAGIRSRIPPRVWFILYGLMILSLGAAGYLGGLTGARKSFAAVAYIVVFAAVILMIVMGDIPGSEQFRSSHQALIHLRHKSTET